VKLLVILPVLKDEDNEERNRKELANLVGPGLSFELRSLRNGPASIESEFDDRMASPWVLKEVMKAQQSGFDAIFVSCMGDVATNAARELTSIPIIAPLQTCLAVASTLGDRIGIVTVLQNLVPILTRKAREYGFDRSLVGVRSINVPVLDIETKRRKVVESIVSDSKKLVDEDHADSVILGCTGLLGVAREVQDRIDVPVLDPVPVSVRFAQFLVATRLTRSERAFPPPPAKPRRLPGMPLFVGKPQR
jgi:allantoin racemase